jgi:hypothetical protein
MVGPWQAVTDHDDQGKPWIGLGAQAGQGNVFEQFKPFF